MCFGRNESNVIDRPSIVETRVGRRRVIRRTRSANRLNKIRLTSERDISIANIDQRINLDVRTLRLNDRVSIYNHFTNDRDFFVLPNEYRESKSKTETSRIVYAYYERPVPITRPSRNIKDYDRQDIEPCDKCKSALAVDKCELRNNCNGQQKLLLCDTNAKPERNAKIRNSYLKEGRRFRAPIMVQRTAAQLPVYRQPHGSSRVDSNLNVCDEAEEEFSVHQFNQRRTIAWQPRVNFRIVANTSFEQ